MRHRWPAQNSGGIRNNSLMPAGNITELHTFQILACTTFVSTKEDLTATQLKAVLETSVSDIGANGRFGNGPGLRSATTRPPRSG